jgi:Phage integrase, N-terminal SAM-like domain/Phage integrase family
MRAKAFSSFGSRSSINPAGCRCRPACAWNSGAISTPGSVPASTADQARRLSVTHEAKRTPLSVSVKRSVGLGQTLTELFDIVGIRDQNGYRPRVQDFRHSFAVAARFFEDFLPAQRGVSPHTLRSYRDSLLLLLQFVARDSKRPIERLEIADLTPERITRFLSFLEAERKNGIATRNARLGAVHVFARFMASHHPEQLGALQRIIGLPFKRGAQDAPIEYLERAEIEALLNSIDRTTTRGRCDYALFALMFNTGARVQEVLDLRRRDVRIDAPCQVRLHGKGSKVRLCPIWPATARRCAS